MGEVVVVVLALALGWCARWLYEAVLIRQAMNQVGQYDEPEERTYRH